MSQQEIKTILSKKIKEIDKILEEYLEIPSSYEKVIHEAISYSLFAEGKRIRPILMIEAYRMLNSDITGVKPFAAAIEMIHTYSLIHDDLPAMDNDDYRRGKLTNHKVYGEGIAILAGDALLNLAFETMIQGALEHNSILALQAMKVIGKAAGVKGMIGGQAIDLLSEKQELTFDTLHYIHEHKTASLITGALQAGIILSGGNSEQIERIKAFGYALGMAFQIQDDILDQIGSEEALGKAIHSDQKNGKLTYLSFESLEIAKEKVRYFSNQALESLAYFGDSAAFLIQLTNYLMNRSY
ncbi:MAG: polyprenyl synthetase family protein [Epulopiscium sp.]|nr:polyprenyl synthetase family protein [Candidatus Epulonipiscium sp.]